MSRPLLLDLFCGAGGSAVGYHRAGFDVVGVDIEKQPHFPDEYPFEFIEDDALDVLARLSSGDFRGYGTVDVIHASPPCQHYSVTASLHDRKHPALIEAVRNALVGTGLPYVIENVVGAPLINPIQLCGSSFGLGVRRHRLFETHPALPFAPPCVHWLQPAPVDVTGTGGPASREPHEGGGIHRKPRDLAHAREVMDIDWMSRRELSQAIPPAYTEFIGEHLLSVLGRAA